MIRNIGVSIVVSVVFFCCVNIDEREEVKALTYESRILLKSENSTLTSVSKLSIVDKIDSVGNVISDTISIDECKFLVYGKISKEERYRISRNNVVGVSVDSIEFFTPIETILKVSAENLSLFPTCIFSKRESCFINLITKIEDINNDGKRDILIYDSARSGNGQNSTYLIYLRTNKIFKCSFDFSKPNLFYIHSLDKYYSRSSGGGGGNCLEVLYDKSSEGELVKWKGLITKVIPLGVIRVEIDYQNNDTLQIDTILLTNDRDQYFYSDYMEK